MATVLKCMWLENSHFEKADLKHPDAFEITVTEGHMELTQKSNGIGTTAPDINKLRYCIYS